MNYKMYYHIGSENHGCEALVRSTKNILQDKAVLFSMNAQSDKKYKLQDVVTIIEDIKKPIKKKTAKWFISALAHKINKDDYFQIKYMHKQCFDQIHKGDICFSIGGDNYCYPGQDILSYYNRVIHSKNAKTVLWGCSVEPELLRNPEIAKDVASYDLITARESISYAALKMVNSNTVLVSDPAFSLPKVDMSLPKGWIEGKMIGINASPLILQSGKNSQLVLNAYRKTIEYIINNTGYNIALIPHVVIENNDDRTILQLFYEEYKDTGRIIMISDCNCMELKGYISRCRMLIASRTHASIAAYSTYVPTLVLGYSVKSIGIARDLFGTEENYVVSVNDMVSDQKLLENFKWLMSNEKEIRKHLKEIMPAYIENVYKGKTYIENL